MGKVIEMKQRNSDLSPASTKGKIIEIPSGDVARFETMFGSRLSKGNIGTFFDAAVKLDKEKKFQEATVMYKAILAIDNGHIPSLLKLAQIYGDDGKHSQAIDLFTTAKSLDNNNPEILSRLDQIRS